MAYGRLRALAAHIPPAGVIADIGCDHGLLCDLLLKTRPDVKVIAADISAPSLEKARRLLARHDPSRFDLRLGDGLSVLGKAEADLIVICGVGGPAMTAMLHRAPDLAGASALFLSPHGRAEDVRAYLHQTGIRIRDEWIVEERGRFYPVLLAEPGGRPYTGDPFWNWIGQALREKQDPVIRAYVRDLKKKTAAGLAGARFHDPVRAALLYGRLQKLREEF